MSFGKRNTQRPQRAPAAKEDRDDDDEAKPESSRDWDEIIRFGSPVVVIVMIVGMIFFRAPFTYSADEVKYSRTDLVGVDYLSGMVAKSREETEERLNIDFSGILKPVRDESTPNMHKVASICLPRGSLDNAVIPSQAPPVFRRATDYMDCIMRTERRRFCDPVERTVLVEKLLQYADRRQNMLAIDQRRAAMHEAEINRKKQDGATGYMPPYSPKFSTQVHPKITQRITELRRDGLISPSDFGWYGLFVPEEYAAGLAADELRSICG